MSITNEKLAELLSTTMQQADRFRQKLETSGFVIVAKDAQPAVPVVDKDHLVISKAALYNTGDELSAIAHRLFSIADEVMK